MTAKITCFVAMAFGRKETETLYSKSIKPAILSAGLRPRCLAFIEHNDDLNNRIMKELQNAQIVVADLTFARPSVYYEAGFAERAVKVVYTCKQDHLDQRKARSDESFRVHFDLQMKNIISWRKPEDSSFTSRLTRRLKMVALPLTRALADSERERELRSDFASLSIHSRLTDLYGATSSLARSSGFSIHEKDEPAFWVGKRLNKRSVTLLAVYFAPAFNKTAVRQALRTYSPLARRAWNSIEFRSRGPSEYSVQENIILCSLSKAPVSRLREIFDRSQFDESRKVLSYATRHDPSDFFGPAQKKPSVVLRIRSVYIVDSILHLEDFRNRLKSHLLFIKGH